MTSKEKFISDIIRQAELLGFKEELLQNVQILIETGRFTRVTAFDNAIKGLIDKKIK